VPAFPRADLRRQDRARQAPDHCQRGQSPRQRPFPIALTTPPGRKASWLPYWLRRPKKWGQEWLLGEFCRELTNQAGTDRSSLAVSAIRSTWAGSISGGIWMIASLMPISRRRPMKSRSASGESQGCSSGRIAGT
jgi:hypothetical protein